jgi:hypothetical protein
MSQVVIGDILPYTQAVAIASQTVFGTNWTANYATDVIVFQTPEGENADDATQQLMDSEFSVAFIGAEEEVEVTLVTPAAEGDIITITRMTPADRENLYSNTNFTPSMLNNDFGILTLVDQQAKLVNQLIGPRYNYSAEIEDVVDTILPILGPNQIWIKNADDTAIEAFTVTGETGSGTVNPGSQNQLAWYAATSTAVSGLPTANSGVLVTSSGGVPSISSDLPLVTLGNSDPTNTTRTELVKGDYSFSFNIPTITANRTITFPDANITLSDSPTFNEIVVQTFTSNGTYTPTAGMVYAIVEVQAGGGGGGGVVATAVNENCIASGGGGGAYSKGSFSAATIGASKAVTIGAAGTAGANTGTNGGNGGNSSLGALIVCTGGVGGLGNASAIDGFLSPGGAGGVVSTPGNMVAIAGQRGDTGFGILDDGIGGNGGNSQLGFGGTARGAPGNATPYAHTGDIGTGDGAGGSGGISLGGGGASAGTAGTQGIIIVTEFVYA